MKNKFLIIIIIFFTLTNGLNADQFEFYTSNLEASYENNTILASEGKAISKDKKLEISGEKFKYNKSSNFLEVEKGYLIEKKYNLKIFFNLLEVDGKKLVLEAKGNVKILDLNNNFTFKSNSIKLDRLNNILSSSTTSTIEDSHKNLFNVKKFTYEISNFILNIENGSFKDSNNNKLDFSSAFIDTKSNKLFGKDIELNYKNLSFNKENEPRIKGEKISYDNGNTEIEKGIFTVCKKTDTCPPWELTAEKITHNKKKKNIDYKNVWLKIYDVPVVYFPKFFHPDPTVKRQSGFLMPSFKNSPNKNTYFSIPYYKVISENKDMTFTPRLYTENKFLAQTEYREVSNSSTLNNDFSFFKNGDKLENHLFVKFNKSLNYEKFDTSSIDVKIQQSSNDTYLKYNKISSPLLNNYETLENTVEINLIDEVTKINGNLTIYENLNYDSNDKYEYIYPKINLEKKINNNTKLDGNFLFKSDNYIHKYNTNISEKINTNDLIFESAPKITNNGFYNNYEFIIKNSNTSRDNHESLKNSESMYISGLYQFNSSMPLIKSSDNYKKLIKPKLSIKLSPNNTKNISKNFNRLDANNIFNLNRLSSQETLEGGLSLSYGSDYVLTEIENNREVLSLKIANNLRLNQNKNLERNNQLGARMSNIFSEIVYSPNEFLTTKYNMAMKNNIKDINYENLSAKFKINNFITTFDYLNENNSDQNSYLLNKTSYNFNDSNKISFSTRENKKTDLVEYYNLMYQYQNDCLAASIEYNKDYYSDRDIKPEESIFFKLTIVPFGSTSTPNLMK